MKLNVGEGSNVLIGKRVTVGAAINSVIAAMTFYFPDHATPMVALGVPLTFGIQIWIAHTWEITNHES